MENTLLPELIQNSQKAPSLLKGLMENFLSIESDFNRTMKELEDEKNAINTKHTQLLSNLNSKLKSQIGEKEKDLSSGKYAKPIIEETLNEWKNNWKSLVFAKVGSIIGGIVLLFLIRWEIAIFVGLIGFAITRHLDKQMEKRILVLKTHIRETYTETELESIKKLSNVLKVILERKVAEEKREIDLQKKNLITTFKSKEADELKSFEEKISSFNKKESETVNQLKQRTDNNLDIIKRKIKSICVQLDQLPETFDNTNISWTSEMILKGKDIVAPVIKIANEFITINCSSIAHKVNIPRLIPFLNSSNLVFNCKNSTEIKQAINISHNLIARTLLALPSSKVKLTFVDPLELGGNASPFTPLLREIYGGMVFTQQNDIENQLSILTRAIENVIQRYLQDKFKNIAEYNFVTKEVPEPYRILVVYNFPHGFNDTTASKLINIIKSGPKAGIHTILINDLNGKLPYGMDWKTFENLNIEEISLLKETERHKVYSFDKNLPYNEIVEYINKELPNSSVLKVPFTKYITPQTEWWKEKAHKRYAVPIGRHGTEVQNLKFDNEDDNQALLIGKPGSGKSNLLHVIIANSLWKYSPDQLEIYLIDFKGGVEFTVYADKKIPHIRTIAIESEREFGLSVLDGVEKELLRREMEFSNTGVQNIEQYHEKFPNIRMPRVLLIVDEFQEFFAEDDSIKQSVDDKFDRIVRKGRAFGINSLFSSQTLSGNSIKKSTKELIDIRVALMCSDLDATQILDDRNPGARDLTRPGEGIYNPENGKIEGNKRFQAFFIGKEDLEKVIEDVVAFAGSNENSYKRDEQIIFRGSEKAHIEKENHPLKKTSPIVSPRSLKLWIGEPVAIAEDVTVAIRKQGGSNVLIAGYDETIGVRIMASLLVSIAVQHVKNDAVFYSFNSYNIDSELFNIPESLYSNLNQKYENVGNKGSAISEKLQLIKAEIENRLEISLPDVPNIYLTFFSFQRCRAFRKDGYSMTEEGQLLSYILKEGPDVGIFTLLQVDTMDNFSKNLDDKLLKEFSQRVASQMNPDNSVKIIGNQKASKLGANRAWFYDDNENVIVKFKPYELPNSKWISQLQNTQSTLL